MFKRELNDNFIAKFKDSKLFEKIKDKISNKDLFLAIRNGYINIYNKGQSIYKIDKIDEKMNIETHYKYLFDLSLNEGYLKSEDFGNYERENLEKFLIHSPLDVEKIIKNSGDYAGVEKEYTYNLLKNNKDIILDVEIALVNEKNTTDRIDFLYINGNELQFVEVKRFNDYRLQKVSDIAGQLKKYNEQISKNNKEILEAYKEYIELYREFFPDFLKGIDLEGLKLNNSVNLFIVEFDGEEKKKLPELLENIKKEMGEEKLFCQAYGGLKQETKLNFKEAK